MTRTGLGFNETGDPWGCILPNLWFPEGTALPYMSELVDELLFQELRQWANLSPAHNLQGYSCYS